jgi:phosphate/sulfate permease
MKVEGEYDRAFYYYSISSALIVALIIISISVSKTIPISTTQTCIFSVFGASISLLLHDTPIYNKISLEIFIGLGIVWLITPFFTMFVSCLLYWIIKKTILGANVRIRAFIITTYISGIIFAIYFSFIFTTPLYQTYFPQLHPVFFGLIVIFLGFYVGLMFKRMHFFVTKVTPRMRLCTLICNSFCVL